MAHQHRRPPQQQQPLRALQPLQPLRALQPLQQQRVSTDQLYLPWLL